MNDFERGVEAMRTAAIEICNEQENFATNDKGGHAQYVRGRIDASHACSVNIGYAKIEDTQNIEQDEYLIKLKNHKDGLKHALHNMMQKADLDQSYIKGQIEGIEFVIDKIVTK